MQHIPATGKLITARYFCNPDVSIVPLRNVAFALLSALYSCGVYAQPNDDSFDVTVEPSESQQEVVTQGPATLDGSSLGLRSLQQITNYLRGSGQSNRRKRKPATEPVTAALLASLGFVLYETAPGATGEQAIGTDFSRLGSFADISYGFGSHDTTSNTPAHDIDTLSVTAGVDYRFSPTLVFGGAFVYSNGRNDFNGGIGDLQVDGYSLAALGSWYPRESWYVDGIIRVGLNDYESRRQDSLGGTATGSTDGSEFTLSAGSGYELNYGAWSTGPILRVNYTNVSIDNFSERNSSQALNYDDQDVESLTTNLGAQASRAVNTNFGVVLPQANVEWIHEFDNNGRRIVARPVAGGAAFAIPVDGLDSNFFRGSLGTTLLLKRGRMLFARYEGELGRANRDNHSFSLGARLEF